MKKKVCKNNNFKNNYKSSDERKQNHVDSNNNNNYNKDGVIHNTNSFSMLSSNLTHLELTNLK